MDSEEAWDEFRKSSTRIQKTSIAGKLDTLAAAMQDIKVDTERTAAMVPKIMGDEAALDSANAEAMADLGAGGDPGMGMGPGGEEMMNDENGPMPPDAGGDMGPAADPMAGDPGAGAPDMGAPDMGAPDMGAPDMGAPAGGDMGGDVPPMAGPEAGPAGDMGGDMPTDTEMGDALDGSFAGPPEEGSDMDMLGADPGMDMGGAGDIGGGVPEDSTGLNSAANNLLMALKQAAHQAVDSGDTAKIVQLSQIEQQITQALGSVANLSAPTMTAGPAAPPEAPVDGESDMPLEAGDPTGGLPPSDSVPMDSAPIDEAEAEDDDAPMPPLEGGDDLGEDDEEDTAEDDSKESDESKDSESSKDDKEKSEDKKDDDSTKKSADIPEDIADPIADMFYNESDEDAITKSEQLAVPSLEDLMSKQIDMLALIKSTTEDVDENEIFHADNDTEALEASADNPGDDTMCNLLKADDRIATARSIFDIPMESGTTDPDSIATSGEAQAALDHTGSQDPNSISSADPIIEITKSAEDISKPKENSGTKDPDSIATAESPEVVLSHKGTQDPDSIATADEAVDMDSGDDSEGTKTTPKIAINKAKVGREILSLQDMMRLAKSDSRPSYMSAFNSELERPELGDVVRKSASPIVKMGRGVDPMDVIKNDLEQYNIYKAGNKF